MSASNAPVFDDRTRAQDLIREIAGHCWRGKGDMLDRVHAAIRRVYPSPKWTRRRVRAMWHREQAVTAWREVRELEFVAALEAGRRTANEEARREHSAFLAQIGATLDQLEVNDAEFHREHREALRQLALATADLPVGNDAGKGDIMAALGSGRLGKIDE